MTYIDIELLNHLQLDDINSMVAETDRSGLDNMAFKQFGSDCILVKRKGEDFTMKLVRDIEQEKEK